MGGTATNDEIGWEKEEDSSVYRVHLENWANGQRKYASANIVLNDAIGGGNMMKSMLCLGNDTWHTLFFYDTW